MQVALVLLCLAVCVTAQTGYQSRYPGVDIDSILSNRRVLKSYTDCFLEKGPCTPQGREGKKFFPEIYETNCAKCSDDQKAMVKKLVTAFHSKRKEDWDKIVDKFDPDHKKEKEFLNWVEN